MTQIEKRRRRLLQGIILAAAALMPDLVRAQGYPYAIIPLTEAREEGEDLTTVRGISNAGHLVGTSINAYIWQDHVATVLYGLNSDFGSIAFGVNSSAWVVGKSNLVSGTPEPTLWIDGVPQSLGNFGGERGEASAINELGHVVGRSHNAKAIYHGFVWRDGQLIDLGSLTEGRGSSAWDLNDFDQVVGHSILNGQTHGFMWDDGVMTPLGTLGGNDSWADGINNLGQIVGWSEDINDNTIAFLWENGQMRSIHNFALGTFSQAYAINIRAEVVGMMDGDGVFGFDGFVWNATDGMRNIETLLPPNHRWDLVSGEDINDFGQIAAYGFRQGSAIEMGLLITPVHPTLTLQGPAPGIAGQVNGLRAVNCTPGQRIYFVYGLRGGGHDVPNCDLQSGAVFQMDNPILIGSAIADANGVATLTAFVPNAARNIGDILLQAVELSNCKISQLIVTRFQ